MPRLIEGNLLFGSAKRAAKIIHWSEVRVGGARLAITRESGITLEIVARESKPRVFIYFSPEKFLERVEGLPNNLKLSFQEDGFEFDYQENVLQIMTGWSPKLWAGAIKNSGTELLGMVEVSSAGNFFYDKEESAVLPGKFEALAVFDGVKKRELSEKSKSFLARDAILNAILRK